MPRYKREKIKLEESWYNLWPQYRKELKKDLQSGKYKFVATTDITAYFEDINLITLGEILKKKTGGSLRAINMIVEILTNWSLRDPANVRQSRGLPQGINMSGVLSNHYLQIIDEYLEGFNKNSHRDEKIKWYRYCDDINILTKKQGRARAILLKIGGLLRTLGLNQNAKKTEILTADEALEKFYYSVTENISEIIEGSKKKSVDLKALIANLRNEYKKLPRCDKKYDKKHETALFHTYNAAKILDSKLLIKRTLHDFRRFPERSKSICGYVRRFINMPTVFKNFKDQLSKKNSLLLYNYQLAFLVSVFRHSKRKDKELFKYVLDVASNNSRHWYVRVQAINALFYLGVNQVRFSHIKKLVSVKNHRFIRRSAITLFVLCHSRKETVSYLSELAKELDVTVSRMANFLLTLIHNKKEAMAHLRKFTNPQYIFLGDQIWRLWFIVLNKDNDVQKNIDILFDKLNKEYRNYPIIKEHIEMMKKFKKTCE